MASVLLVDTSVILSCICVWGCFNYKLLAGFLHLCMQAVSVWYWVWRRKVRAGIGLVGEA